MGNCKTCKTWQTLIKSDSLLISIYELLLFLIYSENSIFCYINNFLILFWLFQKYIVNIKLRIYLKSYDFQICIAKIVKIMRLSPTYRWTITAPSVFGSLYAKAKLIYQYLMSLSLLHCFAYGGLLRNI